MERSDVDKIRESIKEKRGERVEIQLDRGRNKIDIEKVVQSRNEARMEE